VAGEGRVVGFDIEDELVEQAVFAQEIQARSGVIILALFSLTKLSPPHEKIHSSRKQKYPARRQLSGLGDCGGIHIAALNY
jgi:hypothetical protein